MVLQMAQGHSVDEYLETIYFLAFPIGEDRPQDTALPPRGGRVDTTGEQGENRELEPLSALEPGATATIVRLAEHDGDLLHWFYDEGLVPGAEIVLRASQPAAGQFRVKLDGTEKAIGEKAAAGLFVKPA